MCRRYKSFRDKAILMAAAGLVFFWAGPLAAQAETVAYHKVNHNLYDIHVVDQQNAWACGKSGFVYKTQDGGKTWEEVPTALHTNIFAIYFFDKDHGLFASENGLIMATQNGGKTWEKRATPVEEHLLTLDFYDAQNGMAAGDWGKIVVTHDGGKTWQNVSLAEDVVLYALKCTNPNEVWIAGEIGTIFHTTDGGVTWQKREVGGATFFGIDMDADNNGVAVGLDGNIARTLDGGGNWEVQPVVEASLYNVAIGKELVVAVGDGGTILTLDKSGGDWRLLETPLDFKAVWFQALAPYGDQRFIMAGNHGSIRFLDKGTLVTPEN